MQVVFFGSSEFSVIVLEKVLRAKCPVLSVVTTPDKPAERYLIFAIGGLALAACGPKPTEATPTPIPNLNVYISDNEGWPIAETGEASSDAGAVANMAVENKFADDALNCAIRLAYLPPFVLNEKEPTASQMPRHTKLRLPKECLGQLIASMSK